MKLLIILNLQSVLKGITPNRNEVENQMTWCVPCMFCYFCYVEASDFNIIPLVYFISLHMVRGPYQKPPCQYRCLEVFLLLSSRNFLPVFGPLIHFVAHFHIW